MSAATGDRPMRGLSVHARILGVIGLLGLGLGAMLALQAGAAWRDTARAQEAIAANDCGARLEGAGGAAGRLRDISAGGALWQGEAPGFLGGCLVVAGVAPIEVGVVSRDGTDLHLAFADPARGKRRWHGW